MYWNLNNWLMIPIITRKAKNKIYNLFFLKKYNIFSDYSTYIFGLKYMNIGSITIGRDCRIEIITEYNGKN